MRELAFALLALTVAGIGRAEPVRFDWTGSVASVDPAISIPIGTPAYGHYVFESTTADTDPSPGLGQYDDALLEWRVVVEGLSDGTIAEPGFGSVAVDLGFEGAGSHVYEVRPGPAVVLRLTDLDGAAFASDGLPLVAPPLAAFEGAALAQLDPQTLAPLAVVEVETLAGPTEVPALPGWGVPVLPIAILILGGVWARDGPQLGSGP